MSADHGHEAGRCRELLDQLSEYLDGELDVSACREVEGHMEDCPPCQAFLESLRRTVEHVRAVPGAALTAEMKRELVAAYQRLGPHKG